MARAAETCTITALRSPLLLCGPIGDLQRRRGSAGRCKVWFGRLLPHGLLEFRPSSPQLSQSPFQVGHFLLDLAQLCLVLAARQTIRAKLLSDVLLKLTPQDPEIWISPYRPFSVFKFAGSNALHNEVPAHPIFFLGRYIAEGCPLAIPLPPAPFFPSPPVQQRGVRRGRGKNRRSLGSGPEPVSRTSHSGRPSIQHT